ncbi:hypothetical protein [Propionibacterium acidifaciens]
MAGVAGSYGLVAQTVGNWVAGWRRGSTPASALMP